MMLMYTCEYVCMKSYFFKKGTHRILYIDPQRVFILNLVNLGQ